ncbi:MAG: hypothetical protein LKG79_08535 [Furfurilactobacillus sp.]|jgi:predicted transcriptional regulator YdeE|uniref:Uncharacterized protein n=2 Tax=Furfurilactobacillus TaxID=2767882 RepID=A0A0R1RP20_9LACO|nr:MULTISPECIES: hypothetical protein [Furfurilactobacillus]KRL55032.1 hypothetical protein FD35_GL002486 [Furfurilactobacillus rossiae DSM 15814]MCF6160175.1 hypothetical protein [Furfurilactobacillus milii]MCF6162118.1 hypothetical protein [Furfurilactobacillus milii]MCF6420349.1 hypothetical protein [Furfurilactobacillus milii]MCH4012440.1 hypothetical protein [Furfurilactobacillus sp.]
MKVTHRNLVTEPARQLFGLPYKKQEHGSYNYAWLDWETTDKFKQLETINKPLDPAKIGLLVIDGDETTYWIGKWFRKGQKVPEGFQAIAVPESSAAVAWVNGNPDTGDLFGQRAMETAHQELVTRHMMTEDDWTNLKYVYERYDPQRFQPEENPTTLDYIFYVK